MTRINVVSVTELCDQHLLAEHRELTRIPNDIVKREGNVPLSTAKAYLLGAGHVTFFRNKLKFLKSRYDALHQECLDLGFNVVYKWPDKASEYAELWQDYVVTEEDILLNQKRIQERMPENPRFTQSIIQ